MEIDETLSKAMQSKTLSRRTLLTTGAAASAAAVAVVAAPSLTRSASAAGGKQMVVRVEDIHITLNVLAAPSATYFITQGNITEIDGQPADGEVYCRGVFTNPGAAGVPALIAGTPVPVGFDTVEQQFHIVDQGLIIGSGDEGNPPLAVTGGTGHFTGVHGTYSPDAGLPIPLGAGIIIFTFNLRRG